MCIEKLCQEYFCKECGAPEDNLEIFVNGIACRNCGKYFFYEEKKGGETFNKKD